MIYTVLTYGNPVLREKAHQVDAVTPELRALADDMIATMRASKGIGLAAEQIGRTEALCVIEVPADYDLDEQGQRMNPDLEMPMTIFNPVVQEASAEVCTLEEGCLSFPDIFGNVTRPAEITLAYLNEAGASCSRRLRGMAARAVLHEMDHLDGVVFIDHFSQIKRMAIAGKLKRLVRSAREELVAG